jgi:hypothetical protein
LTDRAYRIVRVPRLGPLCALSTRTSIRLVFALLPARQIVKSDMRDRAADPIIVVAVFIALGVGCTSKGTAAGGSGQGTGGGAGGLGGRDSGVDGAVAVDSSSESTTRSACPYYLACHCYGGPFDVSSFGDDWNTDFQQVVSVVGDGGAAICDIDGGDVSAESACVSVLGNCSVAADLLGPQTIYSHSTVEQICAGFFTQSSLALSACIDAGLPTPPGLTVPHGGLGDGGGGDSADGNSGTPSCSGCNLTLENFLHGCAPSPSATCVEQTSSTPNADGTTTKVDNTCYSDGTKVLGTNTSPPADAGANSSESFASQIVKNGTTCGSAQVVFTSAQMGNASAMNMETETFRDSSGNLVATIVLIAQFDGDGGVVETQVITCPGQTPEPLTNNCGSDQPVPSCTTGTCM